MKRSKKSSRAEIPEYARKIADGYFRGSIPPGLSIAHIYHDAWCEIFKGGQCNCNPEIIIETPGDKRHD